MKSHLFRPFVTVNDNGTITIDWSDCYENTVAEDGVEVDFDFGPEAEAASEKLDAWVAQNKLSGYQNTNDTGDRA